MPSRTVGPKLNFSQLTIDQPTDYLLGANDILSVTIPELRDGADIQIISATVMSDGSIQLPMAGEIGVGGLNLVAAQKKINQAFAKGIIKVPNVTIALETKATIGVLVLGQVNQPGVHYLPRYENDVGHAIAAAGGTSVDAADFIEVHRKSGSVRTPEFSNLPVADIIDSNDFSAPNQSLELYPLDNSGSSTKNIWDESFRQSEMYGVIDDQAFENSNGVGTEQVTPPQKVETPSVGLPQIEKIPMRGFAAENVSENQITLSPGDVVVIPNRKHEVFYVVGRLNPTNTIRFTVGDRERELGVGFVLPKDREIDVVTAVAMAGYIDPIESPTTVTVQRNVPGDRPLLIIVDLIAARMSKQETVLVQPGDIIYLNPDAGWWFRTTFDRILPSLIVEPFLNAIGR